jgi:serine/threonine-protein kinase
MPLPRDSDRNLLFGILALQMDFVSRDALVAAMNAWVLDKARPLGQVLQDQGALAADARALLDALVQKHLQMHGGDAEKSLAALSSATPARQALEQVADADVQASLAGVGAAAGPDPYATRDTPAVGTPTSSGLRFRILRPHAKGGLGQVFVARDEELHREVALKEIQDRHADQPESRTRFLLEAEVTGALEHPGIVPVYGLGQYADGRPFYAMRFIKGDSLQEAVERFHRPDGPLREPGPRALALRELLGRFIDVCNAMAYAHTRGVLHRDLKPGNVMLGKYGETLVVDWGLAKAVQGAGGGPEPPVASGALSGSSSSTQMGQAVGTPQYMSPEQAAGRLDQLSPASDVYSLGATLYCVLTGRSPFTDRDVGEVLRKVQRGDFPPPRRVNREAPPALEAVCLKAMALRPEDRYASARALADDVEHWLADEPVTAYRDPLAVRLGRWARRHRPLVAGAAALLVTALVALAVSTVLVSREQARTEEQRRLAEANFQTALRAVDDMLTEVAEEQLAAEPRMEKKRRALLAKAQLYYQQFLDRRGDDPRLLRETALASKRLGDIHRLLGEYEPAREAYDRAIALLTRLAAANPADPEYRHALADSYTYRGEVLRMTGRTGDAEKDYLEARNILRRLAEEFPDRPVYGKDLARAHYNVGILCKDTARPLEAEVAFGEAIKLLTALKEAHPDDPAYRQHLARAYLNLGPVLRAAGRPADAEDAYNKAIALQAELAEKYPLVPDYRYELAVTCNNLGYLLESTHRYPQAEATYRRALDLYDKLVAHFPDVPVYRKELANTQSNLAIVLARGKKWEAAEDAWRQALAGYEQLAHGDPEVPDYEGGRGRVLGNLGWLCLQRQDLARARTYLEQGIGHVRNALRPNPQDPGNRQALRDQEEYLAETLIRQGHHADAAGAADQMAAVFPDKAQDHVLAAGFLARCVTLAGDDGKIAESDRPLMQAHYGDQAVEQLRQAVAHGFTDAGRLSRPPFEPLRRRDDFQKLLAGLGDSKPASP